MSESLALKLFNDAFYAARDPRSHEYQQGAMAALRYRCNGAVILSPYAVGTAQFDAWRAGLDEGHSIWRDWQAGGFSERCQNEADHGNQE